MITTRATIPRWCNGSTADSDSVCLGSNPGWGAKDSYGVIGNTPDFGSGILGSNPGRNAIDKHR